MNHVAKVAFLGNLMLTTLVLAATLKSVSSFDLPGPAGKRFDYLTIDYDDHYLLSAHLAAGLLYVIDLRTNRVVKAIPDVPGAEGVEFVPELKKVYTSNAGDNTIGVIDLKQMKVIKKLPTEAKPDGSAYAAPDRKSTRLNSSHRCISYAVFCLKKKKKKETYRKSNTTHTNQQ